MAFLHKVSGYLVDVNEDYFEEDIVTEIEQGLDLPSQHLHVETAQVEGWDDENPFNYRNCDLAECEKYFKVKAPKVDNDREVKPGQIWKHFKTGKQVKVLAISQDTENVGNYSVVHQCPDGKIWHRPLGMFLSEVDHKKYPEAKQLYRFELVE